MVLLEVRWSLALRARVHSELRFSRWFDISSPVLAWQKAAGLPHGWAPGLKKLGASCMKHLKHLNAEDLQELALG